LWVVFRRRRRRRWRRRGWWVVLVVQVVVEKGCQCKSQTDFVLKGGVSAVWKK
jgi:hypothetical protein